jgi:hypothetical protein
VVGDVERDQLALARNTGIARRAVEPLDERARRELPSQRVLASARAEKKNVHAVPLDRGERFSTAGVACSDCIARDRRLPRANAREQ